MILGSRSAQTPSESSQESRSNRGGGGDDTEVAGKLAALDDATNYTITHRWRKVGSVDVKGAPHHSQVFLQNAGGDLMFSFGLFADEDGKVVLIEHFEPLERYHLSTSYKPNPVQKSGLEIKQAFAAAKQKCGPDYKLLHNNCQKFARIFMQTIGSKHHRHLFHP
ncbi:hypothetical protein ACVDG3_07190 [Meridianimarinicoccus sp. RP-17]|uniref:hypothetical protein n=1 Tax=Meridianimarinicoccus zhengii TaxID=2056810 RepID=UPI000DABD497|nr:hypothetical protein [Phycocomes zhengii]